MANLSKMKRDSLIDKIENLKLKNKKDEDTTLLLNEIINELTGKKYGLVWEQHEENVDKKMETSIPVFDEIKEREICGNPDDKKINFLLEGDNLHSLKLLEKTHKGRIDVIYIDKTTPRLIQFHTLKNAVNPPFLGGFLFSGTVAA